MLHNSTSYRELTWGTALNASFRLKLNFVKRDTELLYLNFVLISFFSIRWPICIRDTNMCIITKKKLHWRKGIKYLLKEFKKFKKGLCECIIFVSFDRIAKKQASFPLMLRVLSSYQCILEYLFCCQLWYISGVFLMLIIMLGERTTYKYLVLVVNVHWLLSFT